MGRPVHARLYDIDETIAKLLASSQGRTLDDLTTDWAYRQACHYALQTIGEAANSLPTDLRAGYPDVPWRKVIGLSHKIRHEYFRLDADVIWEVLTTHLPPLHEVIKRMLADLDLPAVPQ